MAKTTFFQPLQYALVVRDSTGAKINGTGSSYGLDQTCRFAESLLRVMPHALWIDIHPFTDGVCSEIPVTSVRREGQPEGQAARFLTREYNPSPRRA
ncbi:MAG TPA: hypothetical protein VEL31_06870 [Ktedonobacteraceae bacterium]|nr:hypothetical protein [Ktedonobacteraceae bacterium]